MSTSRNVGGRSTAGPLAVALVAVLLTPLAAAGAAGAAEATTADPPEQCVLRAGPNATREHEGVVDLSDHLRADQDLDAIMLFVDFDDAPSDDDPSAYRDRFAGVAQWFEDSSLGRISFRLDAELQWFRMPANSTDYGLDQNVDFEGHRAYLVDAVEAADDDVDFSDYDLLYVVSPQTATAIAHSPAFVASPADGIGAREDDPEVDGALLRFGANIGDNVYQRPVADRHFRVLVHETGHTLGLPDLYAYSGGLHRFVGGWDVMGNDQGDAPDLLAWHKRKLGWLDADQLACLGDGSEVEATLSPVEVPGGTKAIVVRTGEHTAHVAELRSATNLDRDACTEGVLLYSVDADRPSGEGPVRLLTADGSTPNRQCAADSEAFGLGQGQESAFYDPDAEVAFEVLEESGDTVTVRASRQEQAPPEADAGGPYTTTEGESIVLDASGSVDPNTGDQLTHEWDLDGDGIFDDGLGETRPFIQVGRDTTLDVAVRVTDKAGATDVDTTTLTIGNAAPTLELEVPGPAEEGDAVELTGTVRDAGWLDPLDATVDWGTGADTTLDLGETRNFPPDATRTFTARHVYGDDGSFDVEVCGHDDDTSTCRTVHVDVGNVDPTASIDDGDAVDFAGRSVLLVRAGEPIELSARTTDPGSDDLDLTWDLGDGSPEVSRTSLVNPPGADPASSPSVQPRDVVDTVEHAYASVCAYDVVFTAVDDDGGTGDDSLLVVAAGSAVGPRGAGWWAHQARGNGQVELTAEQVACHLDAVGLLSRVFHGERDASTPARAHEVLHVGDDDGEIRDLLDRQLVAAWLNVAAGGLELDAPVDVDGDGTPDGSVGDLLAAAEDSRLDPDATRARLEHHKDVLEGLNTGG